MSAPRAAYWAPGHDRRATWHGSHWIKPAKRAAIYARDGHRCLWCPARRRRSSSAALTLDHLVPVSCGGDNRAANLVTACLSCNAARGARSVAAWLRVLEAEGRDVEAIARRLEHAEETPLEGYTERAARWAA